MSITSALSSALSGLSVTSRQAELVSSNVANAMTPGYARRELGVTAAIFAGTGQGVAITGVSRHLDRALLADRRLAQAGDGDRGVRGGFFKTFETVLGTPDSAGALASRLAEFDRSLTEAAGRPDSEAKLQSVLSAAKHLASGLVSASDDIQQARATADRQIGAEVTKLNATLSRLQDLNTELRSFSGAGRDVSALLDERQRLIDTISTIVPVREVSRDLNQIALFTTGGATLLEGSATVFGFTPANAMTPETTQALGGLSGITLNGKPFATAGSASPILGGTLGGLFAVRDDLAVVAQGKLDAVARDLVERFSAAGLDPTLAPGSAGLFTDAGGAFSPLDEIGLAGRLQVNAAADPQRGGALYRLRDGLGASAEGLAGNGNLLRQMQMRLSDVQPLASSGFTAGARSFSTLMSDLHSDASALRLSGEADQSLSAARLTALTDLEAQNGIDTDQEMQALLVIEKNYAANAKVVQTVENMIDILIRIGT